MHRSSWRTLDSRTMPDRLRPLWDFEDLEVTRVRLREQLEREDSDAGRAEVLTQLVRVEVLAGDVDAGERLLEQAEDLVGEDVRARARLALERGRVRNSSGAAGAARPLFVEAFDLATSIGDAWLAADAAHMVAIAASDDADREVWTERGVRTAASSSDHTDAYWVGPLMNNLGWSRFEAGRFADALEAFDRALEARERDPDRPTEIEVARYAVGKTLRALGRPGDAAELLERATTWADANGTPDGWFHEELAEDYAALERPSEAAEHASIALRLLADQDASLEANPERLERLRRIASKT
jgi:tetratricopeptide (TPR) repeat protein